MPPQSGQPAGDGRVDANDANLLQRAAQGIDVDGDGLSGTQERLLGLWPIDRDSNNNGVADNNEDSDQDGIANSTEIALGYVAWDADMDGDGYVDGDDPQPTTAAGTLVAYVHTDHLGGSAVLTDTIGVVVRSIRYEAFGKIKSNTRPGPVGTLDPAQKYTSQQLDDDTGLYYYGARYYDAQYGRFISADSIIPEPLDPQGLNRYAYVRNSPFNGADPTGHSEEWLSMDCTSCSGSGGGAGGSSGGFSDEGYYRSSGSSGSRSEHGGSSNWELMDYGSSSGRSSFSLAMGEAVYPFDLAGLGMENFLGQQPDRIRHTVYADRSLGLRVDGDTLKGELRVGCSKVTEEFCGTAISQFQGINTRDGEYGLDLSFRRAGDGERAAFQLLNGADRIKGGGYYDAQQLEGRRVASRISLNMEFRGYGPMTGPHEIGHLLGLGHQWNQSGSFMSYAYPSRAVLPIDIHRLVNAYR